MGYGGDSGAGIYRFGLRLWESRAGASLSDMSQDRGNVGRRGPETLLQALFLVLTFSLPVLFVHLTADPPQTRRIHVDLYRYGSAPEVIHVSRGDTVVFTFSSRDTPHSFFLQEYDIDVKVSSNTGEVEVARPSDPDAQGTFTREVVIHAGRPGLAGFFNTKSRFRCHVYCGEMHAFESGFFVVHPNYLHAGATGLLFGIPALGIWRLRRRKPAFAAGHVDPASPRGKDRRLTPSGRPDELTEGVNLFDRWPWLRRILGMQGLQFWLMTAMSGLMYVILLTTLFGTKMAGGNLGVLLLWVVWLVALVVLFVPFGGRIWCTVCPIPMFGDAIQRGTATGVRSGKTTGFNNRFGGLMRRWPERFANAVPRTLVFLSFGTVSILIISQPRWTAWALVILLLSATLLPLIFELRAFCRFLCPINSFISLYAPMGRLALRSRHQTFCEKCVSQHLVTCRAGNEHGWACPYGLSVHEIDTNADCGVCLECIRSCAYDNISIKWRPFGLERLLTAGDQALQAIVMLTLAIVYCLVFLGPWHSLRDMLNIVDKHNWGLFIGYAASLWLIALVVLPALIRLLTGWGARLAGATEPGASIYPRNASPLVPMGLFVWIAFAIPMFLVEGSFVLSTLSDPFGWGQNLFGTAGYPWKQILPESIAWIQAAAVLTGLVFSLRTAHRVWLGVRGDSRQAVRGMLPIGGFLFILSGGLIWFFTA